MPAAAVIPAPKAYINVVAVKKLVVYLLRVRRAGQAALSSLICSKATLVLRWSTWCLGLFTEKKLECSTQAIAENTQAWNNRIGLKSFLLVMRL